MTTEAKPLPDNAEQLLATGQLFHTLAADPRYRKKVLGLIKESSPGTIIPELDVEIDMDRRVTERVKPFEDANKTLTERVSSLETRLGREAASPTRACGRWDSRCLPSTSAKRLSRSIAC